VVCALALHCVTARCSHDTAPLPSPTPRACLPAGHGGRCPAPPAAGSTPQQGFEGRVVPAAHRTESQLPPGSHAHRRRRESQVGRGSRDALLVCTRAREWRARSDHCPFSSIIAPTRVVCVPPSSVRPPKITFCVRPAFAATEERGCAASDAHQCECTECMVLPCHLLFSCRSHTIGS
jgi:hypothetical protein